MQEGVIVLAEIIRRLRFGLDGDRRPLPVLHITLRPDGGMPLRVSRR
jgi:cytochrome P450